MIELAGIIILGIVAQWLAWRTKVPAILPLIIIGLLVGPISTLWTEDGTKMLEPIYNAETGKGIFLSQYLFYFVSLAIGIILFEGGLTLKRKELQGVAPAIIKLISLGSLVTFIGAGLATHFIIGTSWAISFLFSALIIVTGPTVIAPILQNVRLNRNVATVLKWEGILIDPIGALTAVLVFEFIVSGEGGLEFTSHAFLTFAEIILIGFAMGFISGFFLYFLIKRRLIPHHLLNVFTLAMVLGVFTFSDLLAHESGLLSVVVMGLVLGNLDVPELKEILLFKESLSILLISMLFILLAANMDMNELMILVDWKYLLLFLFIILILRPLAVFVSTRGSELSLREKLFISWVGPRGIVAAGIASLFGLKLVKYGAEGAELITPLVFMVVLGTVLLNASTARLFAKLLGVTLDKSDGIFFVGANDAARTMAQYFKENDRRVVLVDTNKNNVQIAQKMGLTAFTANVINDDLTENFELLDMAYVMAMTSNANVNNFACNRYGKIFGERGVYKLKTSDELQALPEDSPIKYLSHFDDYLDLNDIARDYSEMHEINVSSTEHFLELIKSIQKDGISTPLLLKTEDGQINFIPKDINQVEITGQEQLVYLGQQLETINQSLNV